MSARAASQLPPWLWRLGVGLLALTLLGGALLVLALNLGLHSPRPTRPPDREAVDPASLEAAPDATRVELLAPAEADFTLEIDARPRAVPEGGYNGYGLIYRAQDAAHYYAFAVGSDGYYAVLRVVDGLERPLVDWQQFPHIRRGQQPNQLRVACAGAICRFYINDEYAATVEDGMWLEGKVGLWARSYGSDPIAVAFERARMWRR